MAVEPIRSTRVADYLAVPRALAAMAKDFPDGFHIKPDQHRRGQLLYATTGVMTVLTPHGAWVVPPQRAVWVPAGTEHESRMFGAVAMRTLYLRRDAAQALPDRCCVVAVSPLLRELIVTATQMPLAYRPRSREARIVELIIDELRSAVSVPLHLPMPRDARLRRLCEALLAQPGDDRTLERWADAVGASARQLARLFTAETGMGFNAWRSQARVFAALERLARGEPATRVALELGYASPSAFGAMFKRVTGRTAQAVLRAAS